MFIIMIFLPLLILLGSIFQGVAMFRTSLVYSYGIGYWGPLARDGIWHEALIGQLTKSVFPENPGLAGVKLENYHYFYDLLTAGLMALLSGPFPRFFVLYIFFPVVFSILLGIGTYFLTNRLFNNKFISLVAVFLAYFCSSFGWVLEYPRSGEVGGESAFWANQPVSMNLNPPFAISLVLVIFAALFLSSYIEHPRKLLAVLLIVLSGSLIGFKAYAGVLILGALFLLCLKKIVVDKSLVLVPIFVFTLLLALIFYLPRNSQSYNLLQIQPLWLVDTMIDAGDRVGIPNLTARRFAYLGSQKWVYFGLLELLSISIFFIGNLGTRIVALAGFNRKYLKSDLHVFILFIMGASAILPLIFVQKGNPWNIVQFLYYFLYFSALWAAAGVFRIYKSLPKTSSIIFLVVFIFVTPISSVATFRSWLYPNPPAYLPLEEYSALNFLSNQEDGVVLKHPYDRSLRDKYPDPYPLAVYADNAYVSSYSRKAVFVEDVEQQIVLGADYQKRLEDTQRFFIEKDMAWSREFLKSNSIDYIYLPKIYFLPVAEEEYPMTKIFENEAVNIYKVLH